MVGITQNKQHCPKNHIFFFQMFWKDGLSKKIALEFDLSCIIGKDDISFSRKYDLTPRKWMMIFLKKDTQKYDIFFKCSEKMVFSKRITPGHDLSCTIWKGSLFFPKTWYFFPGWKMREGDVSQEIQENMIFSIWYVPRPPPPPRLPLSPAKKKLKTILSRKNTPKGNWHSRSTP